MLVIAGNSPPLPSAPPEWKGMTLEILFWESKKQFRKKLGKSVRSSALDAV
jgi:hypothetical protein